jgi:hypothetical protein
MEVHSLDVIAGRVVRDGRVAVLFSPGFGAGWSTWGTDELRDRLLFDPEVVAWVEGGKVGPVPDMEAKYGADHFYDGGADDLMIRWVPVGARFRVHEYDGSESVVLFEEEDWVIA